ncbi:CRP-like cAMP-binding protein [Variovorax guangxiensis]|nr:CRP-like cAMP-binding protein [Variovorax guangxiensis]
MGVAEGLLKISAVYRTGKVVMFTAIPAGSWVGEGSVIKRELRRYDVIVMRPRRAIFLPGSTFRWLMDTSPEFNHILIEHLNERLAQCIAMVEIDRLTDPVARVARAIGTLYNPVLYPELSPLLTMSHTELGELIGMSRQSFLLP